VIITGSDIVTMTGYVKLSAQRRWFDAERIAYKVNAKGELWTTEDWLNHKDKYQASNQDDGFNLGTSMHPFKWLELNFTNYIVRLCDIPMVHPSQAHNGCGVYFLYRSGALTYIGKSVEMKIRILNHSRDGKVFDSVKYINKIPSEYLEYFEYFYIEEYNPSENKLRKAVAEPIVKYLGSINEVAA